MTCGYDCVAGQPERCAAQLAGRPPGRGDSARAELERVSVPVAREERLAGPERPVRERDLTGREEGIPTGEERAVDRLGAGCRHDRVPVDEIAGPRVDRVRSAV